MPVPKEPASPASSSPSEGGLPPCPAFTRKPGGSYPPEVREYALLLIVSGLRVQAVAEQIGCSTEILRVWRRAAEEAGTLPEPPVATPREESTPSPSVPQRAPRDPGSGLGVDEVSAILEKKKRHPSMGPAQIRAQLKRFKGWRVSLKAIARVLTKNGYELVHTASRPKGEEEVERFEAPHRNALWQMDFAELRVGPERRALLLVQDDFSRYCVAHALLENPTSEDVVSVLREAVRRHGKPEAVYTDRGGPFLAWSKPSSLGVFLEDELIDHHVSPSYRPQGRGKIESSPFPRRWKPSGRSLTTTTIAARTWASTASPRRTASRAAGRRSGRGWRRRAVVARAQPLSFAAAPPIPSSPRRACPGGRRRFSASPSSRER